MRLNLGCADRSFGPEFTNVDIAPGPCVDQIADLSQPWPWADSSVEEILAFDVVEHLPSKRQTMNEVWRVLVPGGRVTIEVPHATKGDGGHCDPTHISYWTASDFEYYEKGNFARERFRNSPYYGVKADFQILSIHERRYETKYGEVYKITAILEAQK